MTVIGNSLVPHTFLLMLLTSPIVHFHDLTGWQKAVCERELGHLYPYAWSVLIVLEYSFNVKL